MHVLVTGSSGLIGSAAVEYFDDMGFLVHGIDNNMRAEFFGDSADNTCNRRRLETSCARFEHVELDIRDRESVATLFQRNEFELIIHAAAQPSHDLAARIPFDDFDVNAVGTLNLLEAYRRWCPEATFIFMSTNKVYGDAPNKLELVELEQRFDFASEMFVNGIPETLSVDQCMHSLFGASKLAADVMTQEYGRYFGLNTGTFRGGCLTGPAHSGVKLHGFLSYLVRQAVNELPYTILGYDGKQVRDQIHAHDVINAFWHFAQDPRPGEVYNLGGGKSNSASILECIDKIRDIAGKSPKLEYQDDNRLGDHICYYSDLTKLKSHYPNWTIQYSLDDIISEMVDSALAKPIASI